MENNKNEPGKNPENKEKKSGNIWVALVISLVMVLGFYLVYQFVSNSQYEEVSYSDFRAAMKAGELAEVEFRGDKIVYLTKEEAEKPGGEQQACFTGLPFGDTLALANWALKSTMRSSRTTPPSC